MLGTGSGDAKTWSLKPPILFGEEKQTTKNWGLGSEGNKGLRKRGWGG